MTPYESSGVAVKYVPKRSIKLGTPRASGLVVTCTNPKCRCAFRAESRKKAVCPFCGKNLGGGK
jgi:hypothetical protein